MEGKHFFENCANSTEYQELVDVKCPRCRSKASAIADYVLKKATLYCGSCGYFKEVSTTPKVMGLSAPFRPSADSYFGVDLWYTATFRNETFWAYNLVHLERIKKCVEEREGENKGKFQVKLGEKLPVFFRDKRNRTAILKLIERLENKK